MLLAVLLGLLVLVLLCLATVHSHDFFFLFFFVLRFFFSGRLCQRRACVGHTECSGTVLPRTCQAFGGVLHGGRVTRVAQSVNVCQPMVVQGSALSFRQ